jgi:hypothetical protein
LPEKLDQPEKFDQRVIEVSVTWADTKGQPLSQRNNLRPRLHCGGSLRPAG